MKKKIIFGILILVVISLLGGCSGKFEMEPDGSLYYEGDAERIEFPQEYDGKANSFTDPDRLYGYDFSYAGNLKRFIKYYSWVFDVSFGAENEKRVYCKDYCLEFGVNGDTMGVEIVGGARVYVLYRVYDAKGETLLESFETTLGLETWLD